jgi:hypothetical protein
MKKHNSKHFAICIKNHGYEVSLEKRKIYPVLNDKEAATLGLVRVVDESKESYLYPENCFISIKLPQVVMKAFAHAA